MQSRLVWLAGPLLILATATEAWGEALLLRARPGIALSPAAIIADAKVGERFCGLNYCVLRPASAAERAEVSRLASKPEALVLPLPFAEKVYFARGVYDAASGAFEKPFSGDAEFASGEPNVQVLVVHKSFLEGEWLERMRARGMRLIGPIQSFGWLAYGPRDQVPSLAAQPHVLRVQEVPAGVKQLGLEELAPGSTTAVSMTVTVVDLPDSPAFKTLAAAFGGPPPVTFRQYDTVAYVVDLTPAQALDLSRRPEVVSVSHNHLAAPSDERSNAVVAGGWPATIGENATAAPYAWDSYLGSLASSLWPTFDPSNQVLGFLDTGVDAGLTECDGSSRCPPFLRGDPGDDCRLVYTTDATDDFADPRRRGRDATYHGSLTVALAAGFAGAERPDRDSKRWAFTQGVAQGARIGVMKMFKAAAEPVDFRNASVDAEAPFSRTNPTTAVRYGLVALGSNQALPDSPPTGGPGSGPGARIFNHSWNVLCDEGYGAAAILLDQTTRSLSSAAFSFGTYAYPDTRYGPPSGALHVVSMGNTGGGCASRLVNTPATAKNAVSVGATLTDNREPYADSCAQNGLLPAGQDYRRVASFSRIGWGNIRTDTMGRLKPDLVAPGVRAYGPRSGNDLFSGDTCSSYIGSPANTYKWSFGTSFAAPVVTGAAALVREWLQAMARAGYGPGLIDPSPAMVKAILIATAKNLCPADYCLLPKAVPSDPDVYMRSAPDEHQGWGGVSLERLFKVAPYYTFVDRRYPPLSPSVPSYTKAVRVHVTGQPISIALAWTDPPAVPTADARWVLTNGLLLEATLTDSGGGSRHYYGNWYWQNPVAVRDGYSLANVTPILDYWNNVQRIDIPPGTLPADGTVTISVSALGLNAPGCDNLPYCQDFALAVWNARE